MKNFYSYIYLWTLIFTVSMLTACNAQENPREAIQVIEAPFDFLKTPSSTPQIAEYIRHIFQDKKGNLWFGTNGYGVAHYDGDSVSYFSIKQGFDGHQITGITEDLENNIWFATDQGIVKYDWSQTQKGKKHFRGQQFWSVFADSKGTIWAGSATGIFRFDGTKWNPFELPLPEKSNGEFITRSTTMSIFEDKNGNIWFSTMGFGAFKYDGQSFSQYTKKDGLPDNSIDQILEDRNGNIWFGTRHGGLSRFNGKSFFTFTQNEGTIGNDEVCVVYEDKKGNIWFSSEGFGVYRYDGKSLTNFFLKEGLGVRAVQAIFEDREGRLWVGGGGGLYRFDGKSFLNVTKNGPWK